MNAYILQNHWHFTMCEVLERRNEKPTVSRPFFFGVWISHTALLHITSDTRNTTYMYECICVSVFCFLLLSKDAMTQKTPGIYAVSFPLLPLDFCVRPVSCLYISPCVCVRERDRVILRAQI